MGEILTVLQILIGSFLALLILIQVKGTGLGRVWGASSVSFTRRGLEKLVFKLTFVFAFLFILVSILQIVS